MLVVGLVRSGEDLTIDRRIAESEAVTVPPISLPVLAAADGVGPEGATVSVESLRGKPVVLNIWASWCGPCRTEAPILERIAGKYRDRGVVVLGLNVEDLTPDAKGFIEEYKLTFPSLRDGSNDTKQALQAGGVPETFIVDADGKMRFLPIRGELTAAREAEIVAHLDKVLGP